MEQSVPEVVIRRLPLYARALAFLLEADRAVISSFDLGPMLGITPAQIRKDLSYFGEFGKQGTGYDISFLLGEINQILGLDKNWPMVLIGVGKLGQAIATYDGFQNQGFPLVAALESDPSKIGQSIGNLVVQDYKDLSKIVEEKNVKIGVIAVPATAAHQVIKDLVDAGIESVLNYAPIAVNLPPTVKIRHIDPIVALQSMAYHLNKRI